MTLKDLKSIAEDQFLDIVIEILEPSLDKLRLILKDGILLILEFLRK